MGETFLVVYQAAVLAILFLMLGGVLANLACFSGLPDWQADRDAKAKASPQPEIWPELSILVPARNEARNIVACVGSLLAQDYPHYELLVLDDHSEDGTASLLRGLGVSETGQKHRLLRGSPLPPGWTGKAWACQQLATAAKGEFLLFTDADTTHAPGLARAALQKALESRADLLSAWPRLLTGTWSEHLVIPFVLVIGFCLLPHWLVLFLQNHPRIAARFPRKFCRSLGAANGQFLLFRRAIYEQIGGHAAVRNHLVEDVALGREITARNDLGWRLWNCEALHFSTCRMYRSFDEVWEGFTKNARAAFEEKLGVFLAVGALQTGVFLLPFLWIWFALPGRGFVAGQILIVFLLRALLAWRFRTSWWSVLFHPFGQMLALAIGLNSWIRTQRAGVSWKGRTYASADSRTAR